MTEFWDRLATPIGGLRVTVDATGAVVAVSFDADTPTKTVPDSIHDPSRCAAVTRQLQEYLAGERTAFDLEVRPAGTAFQRRVWRTVGEIPFGRTATYGQIADLLGDPRAVRAVGNANGANPVPILIPCHRVVGADGSLVGYGGGLHIKRALLVLEGALLPADAQRRLDFPE